MQQWDKCVLNTRYFLQNHEAYVPAEETPQRDTLLGESNTDVARYILSFKTKSKLTELLLGPSLSSVLRPQPRVRAAALHTAALRPVGQQRAPCITGSYCAVKVQ